MSQGRNDPGKGDAAAVRHRIALLWSANSGYLHACMEALGEQADVTLFSAAPHPDAPFHLSSDRYRMVDLDWQRPAKMRAARRALSAMAPDLVLCGGWSARRLFVATGFRPRRRVLCLDTTMPAKGATIARALVARPLVRHMFDDIFLPGSPQQPVATLLGFGTEQRRTGLYCAASPSVAGRPITDRGRRFLFVGRLVPVKGIETLLDAYGRYRDLVDEPWSLDVVGAGPLAKFCNDCPGVTLHGFLQGAALQTAMQSTRALVLPSLTEPWGVVVHEAAHAGCVLLLSRAVGAASDFLVDGVNGCSVAAGDATQLAAALHSVHRWSDDQLKTASAISRSLAQTRSVDRWVDTVLDLAKDPG